MKLFKFVFIVSKNILVSHGLKIPHMEGTYDLDEDGFQAKFRGTPMQRTKRRGVLRNVCVALGNVGDATAIPPLEHAATDPEPLIAEHAQWAIGQVKQRSGQN